jgi:magnesium transporter
MNDLKNELNSEDEIETNSLPQADVSQVVLQLTEAEGEEQAEVFSEILIDAEPGTIALLLESLPLDERYERWQQVDVEERVDVLNLMRADPRLGILKKMPDEELDLLFSQLSPEDLIEWSDSLPDNITDRALAQMGERQRKHFELYNQYTENEIGRYADHQMLALSPTSTVAQGQRFFRRIDLDCNDHLFLVDINDKYLGTVRRYDVFKTVDTDTPLHTLKWDDSRVISADSSLIEAALSIVVN